MQVATPGMAPPSDIPPLDPFSSVSSETGDGLEPDSPCCGGFIDCEGLVEEEVGQEQNVDKIFSVISQLRSTFDVATK
jgi:hypothetical protein